MKKKWMMGAIVLLAGAQARAHVRDYLDTYSPATLEKGAAELELWTDLRNPDRGDAYWVHQTEVEYGVTPRYTLGLYGVFIDGQGFSALKVENRYRPEMPSSWPLDTALYLELKKANGRKENNEIEGKILLGKTWGPVNVTANPILALEETRDANGDKSWELESGLALGTCYRHAWKDVTPGLELLIAENETRLTPGVYIDVMPGIRFNVGVGIGLEKKADDAQLKSILEVEF